MPFSNLSNTAISERSSVSEHQLMENLMKINFNNTKFPRSRIAEKISLLVKFRDSDFADQERYTDTNKAAFKEFKELSPENREKVINDLSIQLMTFEK